MVQSSKVNPILLSIFDIQVINFLFIRSTDFPTLICAGTPMDNAVKIVV